MPSNKTTSFEHLPSDIADVADWLRATPEEINFVDGMEPIEPFLKQIQEMQASYLEFPEDEKRTSRIERLLRDGKAAKPVYVEAGDEHNFIMEGRHRMVAFYRAGLTEIPVCRVCKKPIMVPRIKP